jgi:hypothetical protein
VRRSIGARLVKMTGSHSAPGWDIGGVRVLAFTYFCCHVLPSVEVTMQY